MISLYKFITCFNDAKLNIVNELLPRT